METKTRRRTGAFQQARRAEGARRREGPSGGLDGHALLVEQGLEFASLEHFTDDVAATDELALDVELGNGRPARIFLDALAQLV